VTPAATARELCREKGEDFDAWLSAHLEHGYVWSSPRSFILARAIRSGWVDSDWWKLSDMAATAPDGDCWYIWLAAGDMAEFFEICPERKNFVCFSREEVPRLWEFETIRRLCTQISPR
jgi:hypothetical protein